MEGESQEQEYELSVNVNCCEKGINFNLFLFLDLPNMFYVLIQSKTFVINFRKSTLVSSTSDLCTLEALEV